MYTCKFIVPGSVRSFRCPRGLVLWHRYRFDPQGIVYGQFSNFIVLFAA